MPRPTILLAGIACITLTAEEPDLKAKAEALVREGLFLTQQLKYNEALRKFQEAAKADPQNSMARSGIATVMYSASTQTQPENVETYRGIAESQAKAALGINPNDPIAMEVLRLLQDGASSPRREATPEAREALQEAEGHFSKKEFELARVCYRKAQVLDPLYAEAYVFEGDCYFAEKNWAEAEALFRKGTQVDPLYTLGWKYLVDALNRQGKTDQVEPALVGAISAQPNHIPNWDRLSQLRSQSGAGIRKFSFHPLATAGPGKEPGKVEVRVDPSFKDGGPGESAVWLAYGLKKAGDMKAPTEGGKPLSPFQAETSALGMALDVAAEQEAKTPGSIKTESLQQLLAIRKAGQLEAAIFLLMYREAYRPEFEAWKKANPEGVKQFLGRFLLRP